MRRRTRLAVLAVATAALGVPASAGATGGGDLWRVYDEGLAGAKYIDLTHTITPNMPVWKGFGPAIFSPSVDPITMQPYTYAKDGFEATAYQIATDQFGTQLDPPAHWAPEYPGIDELPPTYAVRPLVVISIVPQVKRDPKYALQVSDIRAFERRLLDEEVHYFYTLQWHRIVPHSAKVRGFTVTPSHYLNQQLDTVWLTE